LIVVVVVGRVVEDVVEDMDVVVARELDVVDSAATGVVSGDSKVRAEHAETATSANSQVRRRMGRR
jgi:hypothetical protein